MEARLVRDELEKCQRAEGVNHYENCKWLAEKYLTMLKENRVRTRPLVLGPSSVLTFVVAIGPRIQAYRRLDVVFSCKHAE